MIAQYEKKLPVPSKLKTEDIIAETFSDFDLNKTEECQDKVTSKTSEKRFSFIFFFEILNPNRKLHFCFSQTLLFCFFFFFIFRFTFDEEERVEENANDTSVLTSALYVCQNMEGVTESSISANSNFSAEYLKSNNSLKSAGRS